MTVTTPEAPTSSERHQRPVSMVERMTLIMDAFERRFTRLTLEEISYRTNLPRSTAHRILEQLVRLAWLEHTGTGYGLGERALGFGGETTVRDEVREAAAAVLLKLHRSTGMIVHLAVLEGPDVRYLDKVGAELPRTLPSRVGGRVPAHTTAIGKAMLAWHSPEHVEHILRGKLTRRTDRTIADMPTLHRELDRVRQRQGVAFEYGESGPAIGCVGAAVRGSAGPVAAISACGQRSTVQLERVAPLVMRAARHVSSAVFSPPQGNDPALEGSAG